MFRIRRIYDDAVRANREAIRQVGEIFKARFAAANSAEIDTLPERLRNPLEAGFRTILYVAEDQAQHILGFAMVLHEPQQKFCLLDYLASASGVVSRGIGGALLVRVRQDAVALGAKGLYFECLPDDPIRTPDPVMLKQNKSRIRFYEAYGARVIINTQYEAPIKPTDTGMPHLLYDDLGSGEPLRRATARQVVRTILERKYAYLCPPEYVDQVVRSFKDDPVLLRVPPRVAAVAPIRRRPTSLEPIALLVNRKHDIHHVRERGYVEAPVRIKSILAEIEPTGLFQTLEARSFAERHITAVHKRDFVDYLRRACASVAPGRSVYPYVFPIRNAARPPRELSVRAGYFCIDTFTPLNRNAYLAAKGAVDCTLSAADELLRGRPLAYSLVRPPGHHAEARAFGGFCYFNNAAIAAQYLLPQGRVAILDVDYHHGNGQQEIFYERNDVLTVSIHGHPNFAYPYFSGFAGERGAGAGRGFNLNLPLGEVLDGAQYRLALDKALTAVKKFAPSFLIVALGLDTGKGDPTGSWLLAGKDFDLNGRMIGALKLPTLVVQEGGYRTRTLGANARHFFEGLVAGRAGEIEPQRRIGHEPKPAGIAQPGISQKGL